MLEYHVESSDKYHIYKVKFDGEGENLIAHCSCPVGKKAGLFCKHIASLLNGDESIIIEPSNKIDELKILSKNSALLEKAKTYIPYDKRSEHYRSKLLYIKSHLQNSQQTRNCRYLIAARENTEAISTNETFVYPLT